MWDENTAKELTAAVGELHGALEQADTYESAMRVLELVPLEVLNLIEEEFHYLWTPPAQMRQRIAYAHLRRMATRDHDDVLERVTSRQMAQWAEGTLAEWLTGVFSFGDDGQQYRIRHMSDGTYGVEDIRGRAARLFHVCVTVVEAT